MLYVIRHGQTEWNVLKKMQGSSDIPLNEKGIAQAKQAKEKLNDVVFDLAFSSPLMRAKQTAEIVSPYLNVITDRRLAERAYGEFEGKDTGSPELNREKIWMLDQPFNPPTVETLDELRARVYSFLDSIKPHKGKTILIATHGGTIRLIIEYFLRPPASGNLLDYLTENCEIRKFEF